ncbi:hypothetical protein A9Q84_10830 [Halobacteriovorax marinus]|uniref:TIGR02117 family protein n=1 Tax=Halobacteriovorax marinus TaxID=97084 RepID=A0A1Y5F7V3_9BACT|nr:hypothetical protein A9Q84_10830 [Halobacteriovorax marinus]
MKKIVFTLLASFVLIPLAYFMWSFILSFVTTEEIVKEEKDITIYVASNPIHTEFLLPVKNEFIDWSELIRPRDYKIDFKDFSYVAIGWGDKRFYFEMPRWENFTLDLGFTALLLPTESVMHFDFYHTPNQFEKSPRELKISKRQYKILISYIRESLKLENDKLILHSGKNYTSSDNFYQARGKFHLFNTCNMWTNKGLKRMGVKTSIWSPFKYGVLKHL